MKLNRIKDVLDQKGISKHGLQNKLAKVSVLSIVMLAIDINQTWKLY